MIGICALIALQLPVDNRSRVGVAPVEIPDLNTIRSAHSWAEQAEIRQTPDAIKGLVVSEPRTVLYQPQQALIRSRVQVIAVLAD